MLACALMVFGACKQCHLSRRNFESKNCVVCATICKYLIICSFQPPTVLVLPELAAYLLRLVGAIEVLELSQVLLIFPRIPPSHSCRCELYSRYARMLTRTVYCELSGQLDWGSSPSSRDLASAAAATSATAATALRRGGGVPKSCSPKPCEEVQGHESLVRRRTDTLGVCCTRPAARNQARSWARRNVHTCPRCRTCSHTCPAKSDRPAACNVHVHTPRMSTRPDVQSSC